MISLLSPVAVFAYNRPVHFQSSLGALSENVLATQSDVFVYLDGPKNESDCIANKKIKEICNSTNRFKNLTVIPRDRNLGLAASIISGVTEMCESYGRVIVLEDDLVISPFFLTYMNDALEVYQNDEVVASIHGYVYPVKGVLPETFFLRGADCWGWGTWKRAWNHFKSDGRYLLSKLREQDLVAEFNFGGFAGNIEMLEDQIAGRNNSWAIRWHASAFLKNMLTLYPGRSLVHNIGFDDSGTHSDISSRYDSIVAVEKIYIEKKEFIPSDIAYNEFKRFFEAINYTPKPVAPKNLFLTMQSKLKSLLRPK
jgi:hypothetical protein